MRFTGIPQLGPGTEEGMIGWVGWGGGDTACALGCKCVRGWGGWRGRLARDDMVREEARVG